MLVIIVIDLNAWIDWEHSEICSWNDCKITLVKTGTFCYTAQKALGKFLWWTNLFFQLAVLNVSQWKVKIQAHQKVNVLCYLRNSCDVFYGNGNLIKIQKLSKEWDTIFVNTFLQLDISSGCHRNHHTLVMNDFLEVKCSSLNIDKPLKTSTAVFLLVLALSQLSPVGTEKHNSFYMNYKHNWVFLFLTWSLAWDISQGRHKKLKVKLSVLQSGKTVPCSCSKRMGRSKIVRD